MAHKAVSTALREIAEKTAESADELRALELSRLDAVLAAVFPSAMAGDVRALDRVLRISERRSKLLGLDAPARQEQQFRLGVDDVFTSDTVEQAERELQELLKNPEFQPRGAS